jgi:ribose transport system permease protein
MNAFDFNKARAKIAFLSNGAYIALLLNVVLYAIYAAHSKNAISTSGITDLFNNALPLIVAAAGGTLIIILRGFDLSVAGVISLTNVALAVYPLDGPGGAIVGLAMVIAIGAVVGLINGVLVAYVGLQSVAVTLATMIASQGVALLLLDAPGGAVSDWIAENTTSQVFEALPVSGLIALTLAGLWVLFRRTDIGISIYAVGKDEAASALSGIDVKKTKCLAFIFAGVAYGVAGFTLSAQTASGNPSGGSTMLLLIFAAIALGGTSFSGGLGGAIGSMLGAGALILLQKVLFSSGVESFYIGLFQGVVMILAVLFGTLVHRITRSTQ